MKFALGILEKEGQVLIGKRKRKYMKNITWDFPGGVVFENESPRTSLKKHFYNQTGVNVKIKKHIVTHTPIENHKLTIFFYLLDYDSGLPMPKDDLEDLKWVKPSEVHKYFTHVLNNKIIIELEKLKV